MIFGEGDNYFIPLRLCASAVYILPRRRGDAKINLFKRCLAHGLIMAVIEWLYHLPYPPNPKIH